MRIILFALLAFFSPWCCYSQGQDYYNKKVEVEGFGGFTHSVQKPGTHEEFWDNGLKKRIETLDRDLFRTGPYKEWYENGNLRLEEEYKVGLRQGNCKSYHENGVIHSDKHYIIEVKGNGHLGLEERSMLHGLSIEYHSNGEKYKEYHYSKDEVDGPFQEWHPNGNLAKKGSIVNGIKVGEYAEYHENGTVSLQGEYVLKEFSSNSEKAGKWIAKHPNGQAYFEEIYEKGEVIDGAWKSFHPNGRLESEGTMKDGMKHGIWSQFHDNGAMRSKIEYRYGRPRGSLVEFYANGNKMTEGAYGESVSDVLHSEKQGVWKEWHENGQAMREVTYEDGRKEGEAKEWYDNGQMKLKTTYWYNGNKESMYSGRTTEWYANGQVNSEGVYFKGLRDGEWTEYFEDGTIRMAAIYDRSKLSGTVTVYYENGNKKSEGSYKMSRVETKTGEWREWYQNGNLSYSGSYINGKPQGICRNHYSNGQIEKEIYYDQGIYAGTVKEFYEDGAKRIEGSYCEASTLRGLRCGPWQVWDAQGNLIKDELYVKGKLK